MYRRLPDAAEVAEFAGAIAEDGDQALVDAVIAMVRGHTRGQGFADDADEVTDDLAAVIVMASARLAGNPSTLQKVTGPFSIGTGFRGFNLAETTVLNRYRVTAA